MTIDWTHFTPGSALAGGVLLGLAAAVLALMSGRILGISGIVGGLFRPQTGDIAWRVVFLVGLALAPLVWAAWGSLPKPTIEADSFTLIIAGLLVGFGTRFGAGCTSGHGVCGLARLSPRSLVATLTFMASGFASVFVLRHVLN
ncbi:MAG: YeeE/YedE family protein [Pseudomonadales bacterium]